MAIEQSRRTKPVHPAPMGITLEKHREPFLNNYLYLESHNWVFYPLSGDTEEDIFCNEEPQVPADEDLGTLDEELLEGFPGDMFEI